MKTTLIFLASLSIVACTQTKKETSASEARTVGLPAFMMTLTSGEALMTNTLPGRLVLIFYNPACDHCQREAEAIRTGLGVFQNYSLYFIAANSLEEIRQFAKDYDLEGHQNILFARAEVADVIREMGPMGTPALFIYSSDKQLVKKFDGETKVEEIVKYL